VGERRSARSAITVAVVGDRIEGHAPQDAIATAVEHAATELGVDVALRWHPTATLAHDAPAALHDADAVWCAPGGPYVSLEGALAAIGFARRAHRPFLGTCAGFQHGVIEIARNVVGVRDAHHAEYGATDAPLFIDELSCSLVGQTMRVRLVDAELIDTYGGPEAVEQYYCRFGLNEGYAEALARNGLIVAGVDDADDTARVMRLIGHPFFVLTLFVPQTASRPGAPHPLVRAYVAATVASRGVFGAHSG
jgi:CTP synthase (UTP-ammonia lyase)